MGRIWRLGRVIPINKCLGTFCAICQSTSSPTGRGQLCPLGLRLVHLGTLHCRFACHRYTIGWISFRFYNLLLLLVSSRVPPEDMKWMCSVWQLGTLQLKFEFRWGCFIFVPEVACPHHFFPWFLWQSNRSVFLCTSPLWNPPGFSSWADFIFPVHAPLGPHSSIFIQTIHNFTCCLNGMMNSLKPPLDCLKNKNLKSKTKIMMFGPSLLDSSFEPEVPPPIWKTLC